MNGPDTFEVEELDSSLQRVIRRRRAFYAGPISALLIASIFLAWEVVRQNLPTDLIAHWPWKLRLLDLQSSATIVTFLALFMITRAQYAQTIMPIIGWGFKKIDPTDENAFRRPGEALRLAIYNGGGTAVVTSYMYRVALNEDAEPSSWASYETVRQYMDRANLTEHEDYYFSLVGAGFPLPSPGSIGGAAINHYVRTAALHRFRVFDIRIQVRDVVGDIHERVLPCRARLRDPAAFIITATPKGRRLVRTPPTDPAGAMSSGTAPKRFRKWWSSKGKPPGE
ncbi:hypothetical protein [Paractinoplanes toevensis]|uniref:hypothetical protein n=1 Tax=Paractinoplanes toevensis TaxID=571911 RepID=UPI001BB2F787|nr:hypothetical protein [Actinoplanes toevensis]